MSASDEFVFSLTAKIVRLEESLAERDATIERHKQTAVCREAGIRRLTAELDTATHVPYKPTGRQEQALAELVKECKDHGLEDVSRHTLTIAPRPEFRPGRGCDIDVSFIGSDYAMSTHIDVYGNGDSPYFLSVDWLCYEYDPCELCVEDEEVG